MPATIPSIGDYGLLGDTRSAALVSRWGGVDWLCWPRFDSAAVFLALLDPERGGSCALAAAHGTEALAPVSRRYLPGTSILETILDCPGSGRLSVIDFMPLRRREPEADGGPGHEGDAMAFDGAGQLVRRFECVEGPEAAFRVTIRPTFDYARATTDRPVAWGRDDCTVLFRSAPAENDPTRKAASTLVAKILHGDPFALDAEKGMATLHLRLRHGERAVLVMAGDEANAGLPEFVDLQNAEKALTQTVDLWREWSRRSTYRGRYPEQVERSILTLKALTYSPTGGIVAAPTLGLPEAAGGVRNYDYRYSWLRDSGFTVRAFLTCGYKEEARAFLDFLARADQEEGRRLPVLYDVLGEAPAKQFELAGLTGYRGAKPVSVGNEADGQTQHDVYGETLNALFSYWEMAGELPPDGDDGRRLADRVRNIAAFVMEHWRDPDSGIWEPRTAPQHYFHSKALCWVALDRAAKLADGPLRLPAEAVHWRQAADAIRAEYLERGWNGRRRAFTQAYDSDELDAAVLRTALFGAIDPHDERLRFTLEAIERELAAGADARLFYRYLSDDGLPGKEGAFTSCAFWVANCWALAGDTRRAQEQFEGLLARGNDLGLFAEEIDPATGQPMGNFPQGFTHMSIVNGAKRIEDAITQAGKK